MDRYVSILNICIVLLTGAGSAFTKDNIQKIIITVMIFKSKPDLTVIF